MEWLDIRTEGDAFILRIKRGEKLEPLEGLVSGCDNIDALSKPTGPIIEGSYVPRPVVSQEYLEFVWKIADTHHAITIMSGDKPILFPTAGGSSTAIIRAAIGTFSGRKCPSTIVMDGIYDMAEVLHTWPIQYDAFGTLDGVTYATKEAVFERETNMIVFNEHRVSNTYFTHIAMRMKYGITFCAYGFVPELSTTQISKILNARCTNTDNPYSFDWTAFDEALPRELGEIVLDYLA